MMALNLHLTFQLHYQMLNPRLQNIEEMLTESIDTVKTLTSDCDKTDYILAATSGAVCGVIDIFWLANRVSRQ